MRSRMLAISLIGILLLTACNTPHKLPEAPTSIPRLEPATMPPVDEEEVVPAEEGQAEEAPVEDMGAGDPSAGEEVYVTCGVCHRLDDQQQVGPGLGGLFELDALPNGEPFSEAALRQWIRSGGGAMPGQNISDADMDDLIAYLKEATQ